MSLITYAKLFHDIFDKLAAAPARGQLDVEQLKIVLRGEDSNLGDWLQDGFGFLSEPNSHSASDTYEIGALCSDRWVQQISNVVGTDHFESEASSRQYDTFYRIQITEHITADYFPGCGAVWVTDTSRNSIAFVHSSRTPLPMLELRLGVIDIITQHLEATAWHTLLGGALSIAGRVFLLVGAVGCGKTTLLTHLTQQGAALISDHRVFLKQSNDDIVVRAFPQTVTIGLGTAMQFGPLEHWIKRPDQLSYYQKYFEPDRVWSTPPEQLAQLPDRLKIYPCEFAEVFDAPKPIASGIVEAVIVPSLDPNLSLEFRAIESEAIFETLRLSHVAPDRDPIYPRWLRFSNNAPIATDPTPALKTLSENTPAWSMSGIAGDIRECGDIVKAFRSGRLTAQL